jgi:hypothetical protein
MSSDDAEIQRFWISESLSVCIAEKGVGIVYMELCSFP